MPEQYDVELSVGGVFIVGFTGQNAPELADAYAANNPLEEGEYEMWFRATNQYWVGPRPGRP